MLSAVQVLFTSCTLLSALALAGFEFYFVASSESTATAGTLWNKFYLCIRIVAVDSPRLAPWTSFSSTCCACCDIVSTTWLAFQVKALRRFTLPPLWKFNFESFSRDYAKVELTCSGVQGFFWFTWLKGLMLYALESICDWCSTSTFFDLLPFRTVLLSGVGVVEQILKDGRLSWPWGDSKFLFCSKSSRVCTSLWVSRAPSST